MSRIYICRFVSAVAACGALIAAGLSTVSAQHLPSPHKAGDKIRQQFLVTPRDGEFRKTTSPDSRQISQSIGCIRVAKPGEPPPSAPDYSHCLRLGPLKIDMAFYQLQGALSDFKAIPEQNIIFPRFIGETPDKVKTLMIPIATTSSGDQSRLLSYLVVMMDSYGTVESMQLTGKPNEVTAALHFSSITLGTPKEKVADILGLPSAASDVPKIKGKLWDYAPFPFTIEFVNGVVYSIRIHSPDDSDHAKAFVPLNSLPE